MPACKGELSPLEVMVEGMRRVWRQALEEQDRTRQLDLMLKACGLARDAAALHSSAPGEHQRYTAAYHRHQSLSDDEIAALLRSMGGKVIDSPAERLALPAGERQHEEAAGMLR